MSGTPNGARVTPFHEQILKVALLPPEHTAQEWTGLGTAVDELWAPGSRQLLPLLARALVDAGIESPVVTRLMGSARRTWVDNQLTFERLGTALEILDTARIRTLALKGVPLALRHYPDPSLRPMTDFDLLVDPSDAAVAVTALRDGGWTLAGGLDRDFVARTSEIPWRSPDALGVLDLHWRLVPWVGRSWTEPDPSLWARATELMVEDRRTLAPADDDLLLHVILHAYRSGWARVPRWVADVVVLLRSTTATFDWDRFVVRVLGAHLALPVTDALDYVATTFEADVPGAVRSALDDARSTRRERRKHRRATRELASSRHWMLGEAPDLATSWARTSVNYTRAGAYTSLGPFLRGRTHVDRLWTLPVVVARRRTFGTRVPVGDFGRTRRGTAMEPQEMPGESTEPIEYEAPRVLEEAEIEAQLGLITT